MKWAEIEGEGEGLHYRALRLLRERLSVPGSPHGLLRVLQERLNRRDTPPSEGSDQGQFGEECETLTAAERTAIDSTGDTVAELPGAEPSDASHEGGLSGAWWKNRKGVRVRPIFRR